MDTTRNTRLITVRDERQAREWALALLSQGIESTVIEDELSGALALEVDAAQCGTALRILKMYHVENRGWGLRNELPVVHLSFNWACLGWAGFLVVIHFLATLPDSRMTAAGVLSHSVKDGEWWRLFTAITLHHDIGHLASNLVTGTLLVGLCMARYGTGLGLFVPWCAAAFANYAALMIYGPGYRSLGASGMVLAALGVLTISGGLEALRHQPGWKALLATLSAGIMLFVLTGSNPASDVVVHFGGFVFGMALGGLMEFIRSSLRQRKEVQAAGAVVAVATTVVAWLFALAR